MVIHGWHRAVAEKQRFCCRAWDNKLKAGCMSPAEPRVLEKLTENMACRAGGNWLQDHTVIRRTGWMRRCRDSEGPGSRHAWMWHCCRYGERRSSSSMVCPKAVSLQTPSAAAPASLDRPRPAETSVKV